MSLPAGWKNPSGPIIVAYDPKTMLLLRDATDAEREAYLAQPGRFRRDFRVGEFLIVEDTGHGVSFAGAGF